MFTGRQWPIRAAIVSAMPAAWFVTSKLHAVTSMITFDAAFSAC
jgi:hypothetical protein